MKKNTNKLVLVVLILCSLLSAYRLYVYTPKESGTLFSLNMSKYYKDLEYSTMIIYRNEKMEDQNDLPGYTKSKEKSKKILDYLNQFRLIEIRSEDAYKNRSSSNKIKYINFCQDIEDRGATVNKGELLTIEFFDSKTLKVVSFRYEHYPEKKDTTVIQYFKLDGGSIDFAYIEDILKK